MSLEKTIGVIKFYISENDGFKIMTFIGHKHMNLPKAIALTCSALIAVALSGNGFSVLGAQTQPANKTFGDWCRTKASLSPEARHTVEVLLKEAGTTDCNAANQKLSSLTQLTLDNKKISDITPLKSLTKLTMLGLNSNEISDVKPLQTLTNLIALSLGKNKISDIKPLGSLNKLISLALTNNKISDITPLKSLINLNQLFLDNNQITDITPLQSLTKLNVLFISGNKISNTKPLQSLTKLTNIFLGKNPITPQICPVKPESICNWQEVMVF